MIASNLRDVCQACSGAVQRMGGKATPAEMSGLAGESWGWNLHMHKF